MSFPLEKWVSNSFSGQTEYTTIPKLVVLKLLTLLGAVFLT